ncbi:MAG TPA: universal stress protein [Ilumatobacteraceae bacterium]|nr:universal stress protein [Ilumatobacteraceae bacterium]
MNEIIVGVDGSATARIAAEEAVALANAYQRPLHIVTSMARSSSQEVQGGGSERWRIDSVGVAEDTLKAMIGELKANVPVTYAVLLDDPAVGLCEEATRLDASVIVVGNKRVQGAARVLGSIAGDVAKRAPCNVLIVNTHR